MEDQKKIEAILEKLNEGLPKEQWVWEDAEGLHSFNTLNVDNRGELSPNLSRGVAVKLFLNKETSELKIYHFSAVKKDV